MQHLRHWMRDRVSAKTLAALVRRTNGASGNWLNRVLYGKAKYNQDGLVTAHFPGFMHDERFQKAYAAGSSTGSWDGDLHWRAHVICWAAERGAALEGDFVECGVNRGGYALAAITYTDFGSLGKRFFLLDTFEGLVERQLSDEERRAGLRGGSYRPCHDLVCDTFAAYASSVRIIKGVVPDTLSQVDTEKIAFLSIDMNATAPEIKAAEYLWDRLVPGACIVLDDYGWRSHTSQRIAFDEFSRVRGVPLLCLPTGQGLILKP